MRAATASLSGEGRGERGLRHDFQDSLTSAEAKRVDGASPPREGEGDGREALATAITRLKKLKSISVLSLYLNLYRVSRNRLK